MIRVSCSSIALVLIGASLADLSGGCEGLVGGPSARDVEPPLSPDLRSIITDVALRPDEGRDAWGGGDSAQQLRADRTPPSDSKPTVPIVCGAFLPSGVKAAALGYTYRWYYTCVEDRDPMCGHTGVLVYGRHGMESMGDLCVNRGFKHPPEWGGYWTYEGAFWCCKCDADYDGVTGYDHSYHPTHRLKIVYGPVPIKSPSDKPPDAPK